MEYPLELDAYIVYTRSVRRDELERLATGLAGLRLEAFADDGTDLYRAARLSGPTDAAAALAALKLGVAASTFRWLELGLRAYALIDGRREYRPWRRNRYLDRESMAALGQLEPEVRYHAPA